MGFSPANPLNANTKGPESRRQDRTVKPSFITSSSTNLDLDAVPLMLLHCSQSSCLLPESGISMIWLYPLVAGAYLYTWWRIHLLLEPSKTHRLYVCRRSVNFPLLSPFIFNLSSTEWKRFLPPAPYEPRKLLHCSDGGEELSVGR